MSLNIEDYNYHLPEGRVAFYPADPRDTSHLLFLPHHDGRIEHHTFTDFQGAVRCPHLTANC